MSRTKALLEDDLKRLNNDFQRLQNGRNELITDANKLRGENSTLFNQLRSLQTKSSEFETQSTQLGTGLKKLFEHLGTKRMTEILEGAVAGAEDDGKCRAMVTAMSDLAYARQVLDFWEESLKNRQSATGRQLTTDGSNEKSQEQGRSRC